jgi:hypothetical protein
MPDNCFMRIENTKIPREEQFPKKLPPPKKDSQKGSLRRRVVRSGLQDRGECWKCCLYTSSMRIAMQACGLDRSGRISSFRPPKKRLPKRESEAERVGFEPTIPCGIPAFQAGALGQLRYLSNSGQASILYHFMKKNWGNGSC